MEAIHSWRELLGKVIAEPQERQRIADALGVNPITLTRWVTNKSNPRQDNLRPLLDALPQYRQLLIELIEQEFPHFISGPLPQGNSPQHIASAFYAHALNAHAVSPARLRVSTLRLLILKQIITHFDLQQEGIIALIAQCVPPRVGQKVRSLYVTYGRGTPPWGSQIENRTFFFGAESQIGRALLTGQPIIMNAPETQGILFPIHNSPFNKSSLVFPLLQSDRVAGCLGITSTQPDYFTQEHLELLQEYAYLMVLAFEPEEFYNLQDIELGIMPRADIQQTHLMSFQKRVTRHLIQASQRNQILSRPQAELLVWQELEEEFLRIAE